MSQSILVTEDKSHTLYSEHFGAHYHSIYGALEESLHVFISAGLYHLHRQNRDAISILEMGFGTGLNALLTYIESHEFQIEIEYHTLESHPITESAIKALNYGDLLSSPESQLVFDKLHDALWEKREALSPTFHIKKSKADILSYTFNQSYDLIYYDAFAPSCQSELWTYDLHKKIFDSLRPNGVLVTYCTQGAFRRTLEQLGYQVERLNGPGKKREMLRATKY